MKKILALTFVLLVLALTAFAGSIKAERIRDDEILTVDLGPIPNSMKAQAMTLMSRQDLPRILVLQAGYKSFEAPSDPTFECWETLDELYEIGSGVYFGMAVANFESASKKIGLSFEVTGGKSYKIVAQKTIPGNRLVAYYVKKSLGNEAAVYSLTTKVGQPGSVPLPGTIIDQATAKFIIKETF